MTSRSPAKKKGAGEANGDAPDASGRASISPVTTLGNDREARPTRNIRIAPLIPTAVSNEELMSRLTESLAHTWNSFLAGYGVAPGPHAAPIANSAAHQQAPKTDCRKRGRGVANNKPSDAPWLSISSNLAMGNALMLQSSRSVISAPLGLGVAPSNEELISRLTESLAPSWEKFVRIFIRRRRGQSDEEMWLSDTQSRLGTLLVRFHKQETSKRTNALPLFIVYNPTLDISISHEVGCPGFSASFLRQYTSCAFNAGVFSPPLDFTHKAAPSTRHAAARAKTALKGLWNLIHYLEGEGSCIVTLYYNEKKELCFYKTETFYISSQETNRDASEAAVEAAAPADVAHAAVQVEAGAREAHAAFISSGCHELYLSSLAAILSSSGSASSTPKMSTYLALGLYGQQRLVNMVRRFNHLIRNHGKRRKVEMKSPQSVGLREVCQEFLVDIGLLPDDMSVLPAARNTEAVADETRSVV